MPIETYSDHPILPLDDGWHPVALARDLEAGQALPVVLAGREIVLWRAESGALRAFVDRCPHRGMRLSFGFVRGDTLSCLYHGWRYGGATGGCEHIPAHPDLVPPKTIAAEAYPVVEAGDVIWLLTGEAGEGPGPVDPALRGAASVTIDAPAAMVEAGLQPSADRVALVQPVLGDRCRVHVVAAPDRLEEAVVFAEALRRRHEHPITEAAEQSS